MIDGCDYPFVLIAKVGWKTTRPERIQGDKHLSIGVCPKHGEFAIQLKVGKYTIKSGITKFYVIKVLSHSTDEIGKLYREKSEINREKERLYYERRQKELLEKSKSITHDILCCMLI